MNLTDEQKDIILTSQNMRPNEILKIQACAGSGKTSTLIEIAIANPNAKILYTAFNRAVINEAKHKFPKNVEVRTWHSLAYQQMITNNDFKTINKLDYFDLQIPLALSKYEYFIFNNQLKDFMCSKDKEFPNDLIKKLFTLAKSGAIPYTHDMYLKEFQMLPNNQKDLDLYDFILLDEAQDTNEVQLDIFLDNNCKKILVGDTFQNIYGFRGTNAINALEENLNIKYDKKLSSSFRCKQEILDRACFFINKYRNKNECLTSKWSEANGDKTQAYITRTNAEIIDIIARQSIYGDMRKYKIKLIREAKELFKASRNILYFKNGDKDKISREFKRFLRFYDLDSLKEYAEDDNDIETLKGIELVKKYDNKLLELEKIANDMYEANEFNLILTTAHTAKGLEWDKVALHSDFYSLSKLQENLIYKQSLLESLKSNIKNLKNTQEQEWHSMSIQSCERKIKKYKETIKAETNLYYVAITRAKEILIDNTPNALEWIETNQYFNETKLQNSKTHKFSSKQICFNDKERERIKWALEAFFEHSANVTTPPENLHLEIKYEFEDILLKYYRVWCSLYGDNPYIVFMRQGIFMKPSYGIYCRVCFHKTTDNPNRKVEVSINTSERNEYVCYASKKRNIYNNENIANSFFNISDIDSIINKLQRDLNYFLEIPLSELQPLR